MSRPRYRVMLVRARDGRDVGWGVFSVPAGTPPCMAVGFTGPFAGLRARFRAARLNRRGREMRC